MQRFLNRMYKMVGRAFILFILLVLSVFGFGMGPIEGAVR